jgi:hypothetical protein
MKKEILSLLNRLRLNGGWDTVPLNCQTVRVLLSHTANHPLDYDHLEPLK